MILPHRSTARVRPLLAAIAATLLCAAASAEVKLPAVFGDGMVLQRDRDVAFWGTAPAGESVSVVPSWSDTSFTTRASDEGRWFVRVRTPGAGGPHTVTVRGDTEVVLHDVLIGEVWICSGQSNMEWSLGGILDHDPAGRSAVIDTARDPELRTFLVEKATSRTPLEDCKASWQVASGENVLPFSAVGFYFGRELRRALGVPVGLIGTYWGGTVCEAWTSGPTLLGRDDFAETVKNVLLEGRHPEEVAERNAARRRDWWEALDQKPLGGPSSGLVSATWQDVATTMNLPVAWEQTAVGNFDGVVWFRREVSLDASLAGKELELGLGPIDDMDTVWWDDTKIGGIEEHGRWTEPRVMRIPAALATAGAHRLTVRVMDTGGGGGVVGNQDQLVLRDPANATGSALSLAGPWKYRVGPAASTLPGFPTNDGFGPNTPTALFNGMVSPLVPFGIRGAIWYQGESNRGRAMQYRSLFPAMIGDWRKHFGQGDFPFYFVQIAPFGYGGDQGEAAELREAQFLAEATPNTGMAVIMDIGEAGDIHPKNKWEVGRRLGLLARRDTYGEKGLEANGPRYESMSVEGSAIRLHFSHAAGLHLDPGSEPAFTIAGEDGRFVPAKARLDGETVVVSAAGVARPVAVRFAWGATDPSFLRNAAGLCASSFRTDSGVPATGTPR